MNKQQKLKTCLQENHYIIPSYQSYGGLSGYQDYGILGTRVKSKFIELWKNEFINDNSDTIVEIETPNVMPYDTLKASGHVDRFTDYIVNDSNGVCHRADHLVKKWFRENKMDSMADTVDAMSLSELETHINKYKMLPSKTDIKHTVERKNLMFEVPSTTNSNGIDFLRPEQAQGIFVNFKSCQQFLQKEPPFGIAQVGKSYRKEISPQQYTRMREFYQAEIEYFVDPLNKTHNNFDKYKDICIPLMTSDMQMNNITTVNMISIEEAVNKKMISHKLMAYFLAKIYLFGLKIGLHKDKIRFRQHLPHEMSHYASECWDLETYVNGDWLECVGCADRGDYDLQCHSKSSNVKFTAKRMFETPKINITYKAKPDMKKIGNKHKEDAAKIAQYCNNFSQEELRDFKGSEAWEIIYCINGKDYSINSDICQIIEEKKTITHEEYTPHVLEPSFGVDRILYSIFEQNFWARENDEQRIVLSLPYVLVPYDVAVFALSKHETLTPKVTEIKNILSSNGFKCYMDNSNTNIGKRYSRVDEMGLKFVVTIDFDTLTDNKVTIRERDSTNQIRVEINSLSKEITNLSNT